MSPSKELLVTLSISYIVDAKGEEEAISQARELLQKQMDAQDSLCLLTAEDFEAKVEEALSCTLPCLEEEGGPGGDLAEVLIQLIDRCEHAPILQGNEGMRGPLLAEAKAILKKHGINSDIPRPEATYQGWITFKDVPMCIVATEKDRPRLTEALGLLLKASHEAGYGESKEARI